MEEKRKKFKGQCSSALIPNRNQEGGSSARHVCRFTAPL
jgi:hypothetical protein